MTEYRVIYQFDRETGQVMAAVPELNYVSSFGADFAEAEQNIMEAVAAYIEIRSPELPVGARVKVIVILESPAAATDALGWPADFFTRFAGSLPDFPDLESEGGYETREGLF